MLRLWIYLVTCLLISTSETKGEFDAISSQCCQHGVQWAGESFRCDNYPAPVVNVSIEQQPTCLSIIEVCCIKQIQVTQCEAGKQTAVGGHMCAVRDSEAGAEAFKECCQCCRLGVQARSKSVSCNSPGLGSPCDMKYIECCQGKNSTNLSFTGPQNDAPETSTKSPEVPPSTKSTVLNDTSVTCEDGTVCEHRCVDMVGGGVECRCSDGYVLMADGVSCQDIDECGDPERSRCFSHQTCHNSPGSYTCMSSTCPQGYDLDLDSGKCNPRLEECAAGFQYNEGATKCEDINECALGLDSCGIGERCENTQGSYACRRERHCGTGYTLDEETQRCQDDDECKLGTHNCAGGYKCRNVQGSFRCVPKPCEKGYKFSRVKGRCVKVNCPPGLRANWANNCVDINECEELGPSACRRHQTCHNTRGSFYCRNRVNCPPGYEVTENSGCQDINECERGTHNCGEEQQCINRQGTYFCQCPRGMRHDSTGSCVDVDECSYGAAICPTNSKCVNTVGSFSCECVEGLMADGRDRCTDIDECLETSACEQSCVNVVGTYFCSCDRGYQLKDDKKTCEDIDECTQFRGRDGNAGVCTGGCTNMMGSYRCDCSFGWKLKPDNRSCEDINECRDGSAQCPPPGRCINTQGSYKCPVVTCPEGFIKTQSRARQRNSIRCRRVSTNCPECKKGLISRTYNFISFANNVIVPAPLFSMTGNRLMGKFYTWELSLLEVVPGANNVIPASVDLFSLEKRRDFARVTLARKIDGPQDVVLNLRMNVTSYYKGFEGMAESRIYLYVTEAIEN